MIKNIIILGDHIQALGISRIASRLGYSVYLFNDKTICLTHFSNTCSKFTKFSSEDELLDILLNSKYSDKSSVLIPTNDNLVRFLSDNYCKLNKKFHISIPLPEITKICYNKIYTYKKAKELGIPIPDSFFPKNLEELQCLINKLNFPIIIKPAVMYKFHKETGKKVFVCNNEKELVENYEKVLKIIPQNEVILQEILLGGAKNLYSYCSFIANHKIYGSFVANRIRQKPMDFGIATTFAKTVINEKIEYYAEKFLNEINYFGLSEVEFMYDERVNDYKLIEINPRTWKWHSISNKIGINLIQMLIDYLDDKQVNTFRNTKENIGWVERVTDTYVAVKEMCKGKMKIIEYFDTIKVEKECACWDARDPLPAIAYLLFLPSLYFTR